MAVTSLENGACSVHNPFYQRAALPRLYQQTYICTNRDGMGIVIPSSLALKSLREPDSSRNIMNFFPI